MANLYRKADWHRVLYITLENGTEIELNSIIVYDKNGIIAKNKYGYFDNDKTIEIKGEIKRKIKVDFSKTENFVIKSKKDYAENRYDLYIYKDNASLQFLGFEKQIDLILAKYSLNGGEFSNVYKRLYEDKFELKEEFEEICNKIKYYVLPYEKEELQKMLDKMAEINGKMLEIEQRIKDFNVDTMNEDVEKIVNRLK